MYCPNCGKEVAETMKFCPDCGKKIEESTSVANSASIAEEAEEAEEKDEKCPDGMSEVVWSYVKNLDCWNKELTCYAVPSNITENRGLLSYTFPLRIRADKDGLFVNGFLYVKWSDKYLEMNDYLTILNPRVYIKKTGTLALKSTANSYGRNLIENWIIKKDRIDKDLSISPSSILQKLSQFGLKCGEYKAKERDFERKEYVDSPNIILTEEELKNSRETIIRFEDIVCYRIILKEGEKHLYLFEKEKIKNIGNGFFGLPEFFKEIDIRDDHAYVWYWTRVDKEYDIDKAYYLFLESESEPNTEFEESEVAMPNTSWKNPIIWFILALIILILRYIIF